MREEKETKKTKKMTYQTGIKPCRRTQERGLRWKTGKGQMRKAAALRNELRHSGR